MKAIISCSGGMNRQLEVAQRWAAADRLERLFVPYYSAKFPVLQRFTGRRIDPQAIEPGLVSTDLYSAVLRKLYWDSRTRSTGGDWRGPWRTAIDRRVANRLQPGAEAIFVESHIALATMRRAKALGMLAALDRTNAHVLFTNNLFAEEYDRLGLPSASWHTDSNVEIALAEYEEADRIVCLSDFCRGTFLEQGIPADRITVVPSGVDLTAFAPAVRPPGHFRVIYTGYCSIKKGTHYLIDGFLEADIPGSELVIVGTVTDEVRPRIDRAGDRVTLMGYLPHSEVAKQLATSSVFVHPSLEEGLAKVLLEAMASGIPVIATPNTGAETVMRDGIDGFVVPMRDSSAIAEKLTALAEDEQLRSGMGAQARERASSGFSWDEYAERLFRALENARSGS